MINKSVSVSLKDPSKSIKYVYVSENSLGFGYPCENDECTPYVIEVNRGTYLYECWGSTSGTYTPKGSNEKSTPGYGAYTSGTLVVDTKTTFYIYIGHVGLYNAVKNFNGFIGTGVAPGGATDVRLSYSNNWWDTQSLISRIMVAAGGGGSEWLYSVGGNGGDLEGGSSISAISATSDIVYEDECRGANQTSGSICPNYTYSDFDITGESTPGTFGSAGIPKPYTYQDGSIDYGGIGGGGYYGGTSYSYAFAGSGGSSFISGHEGCKAVENSTTIIHKSDSYHYSGFIFRNTTMIPGHETMPLPSENKKGFYNGEGAFRITLLFSERLSTTYQFYTFQSFFIVPILLFSVKK